MNNPIEINVKTRFLAEESTASKKRYAFSYQISITNTGNETVRLLTRYWKITDGNNSVKEVHGDGVIGEQPFIAAGDSFEYISGAALDTQVGSMTGSYQMVTTSGHCFDATIPTFKLAAPLAVH